MNETTIIEVSKVIDGDYTKRKRIVYVTNFDSIKQIARLYAKGMVLHYNKTENGNDYDIYEVETKYALYRLKVLINYKGNELKQDAVRNIRKGILEAVIP